MKVCVINFSGNVGESTIAAHLLLPRLTADADSDGVGVGVAWLRGKHGL